MLTERRMLIKLHVAILFLLVSSVVSAQEWVKSAIWYQIFPERFSNGDLSNDPVIADQIGSWPHDTTGHWQIHPWTSDWYKLQPYEKENGKDIWWNITRRRYGGDIQGILNKLDYLQELGINALYLNPLFVAPSAHKYDGAMYHHIEPTFGPDPEGDWRIIRSEDPLNSSLWKWTSADKLALKLISECHKKNIRIIFDGVFNHLGVTSFPFEDILKNGKDSRFATWFTIKQWADPASGKALDYEGWFGIKDLPEIREDENGIVRAPRDYIFDCTKRWMDPDNNSGTGDGIDGWRLDVAFCVSHNFWKDWRKHVKSINPEAYLTAEVIDSISKLKPYLQGDEFDAVMNYNVGFYMADFFIGDNPITASSFDSLLTVLRNSFPGISPYLMQNLFDSHDTNRMASHIVNRQKKKYHNWGEYFGWSQAKNAEYQTRKPDAEERKIQKQLIVFMMTYVGSPMIYYGTEAGMWGANDPDCRKPMIWKEFNYEPECLNARQQTQDCDEVKFDEPLFDFYKQLIALRKSKKALTVGTYKRLLTDDQNRIYVFEREFNKEKIIVCFNNSDTPKNVMLNAELTNYSDVISGMSMNVLSGKLNASVQPHGFVIISGN